MENKRVPTIGERIHLCAEKYKNDPMAVFIFERVIKELLGVSDMARMTIEGTAIEVLDRDRIAAILNAAKKEGG